jgi:hypothetical protein
MRHNATKAIGMAAALDAMAFAPILHGAGAERVYKAVLSPLNAKLTRTQASGAATFTISSDRLTIRISATGVSPSMEHLQHLHGFVMGHRHARCPTIRDDANRDGIIDVVETETLAATTMVPFTDDPISGRLLRV